jgi:hypothetical protein
MNWVWSGRTCSWPNLGRPESESESYVTTDGQSASLSWYKALIRGLRPDFASVRNTEYVWHLRSWFRGAPSLTRWRVCLLYVPLTLASAVFLGLSPFGLATVFYCLRFETSLFVASYDSQGHGGGIWPRLHFWSLTCGNWRKQLKTSVMAVHVPPEIRTQRLPHTSLERYSYTSLLGSTASLNKQKQ